MKEKDNYKIVKQNENLVHLQFIDVCSPNPSKEEQSELKNLLATTKQLKLDFKKNEWIGSKWLRLFEWITIDGKRAQKEVIIVNVPEYLLINIKNTGLQKILNIKES